MANNKEYLTDVASVDLVDAYLKNREYAKAVGIVQKMIALDPLYQERIGSKLPREADQLVQLKRLDEATQLIDLSLKMKPELARQFRTRLSPFVSRSTARNNQRQRKPLAAGGGDRDDTSVAQHRRRRILMAGECWPGISRFS
ncbi:MAG: hypothetical protein QM754_19460 [Tepidisphaeraceae bacterium]